MTDEQNVAKRLRAHRDRIDKLMSLISSASCLLKPQKAEAQALMKSVKRNLRADYSSGATVRGHNRLTPAERAYFQPAVHEASTKLRARWNSNPIRSNWYSDLYDARTDIEFFLNQLSDESAI
jgi:hypothetical protein